MEPSPFGSFSVVPKTYAAGPGQRHRDLMEPTAVLCCTVFSESRHTHSQSTPKCVTWHCAPVPQEPCPSVQISVHTLKCSWEDSKERSSSISD